MANAKQELGRGTAIQLNDGTKIRLVFSMYSLAVVEDQYGSITEIEQVFSEGTDGKLIRNIAKIMQLAIEDDNDRDFDLTQPENENLLLKLIPLENLGDVVIAVRDGLAEGFQKLQGTQGLTSATPSRNASPGARSSTSGATRSASRAKASGKQRSRK